MTETSQEPTTTADPARDPDDDLVRLADAIEAEAAASEPLLDLAERTADRAERERLWTRIRANTERSWELRAQLAQTPATTLAGFRAKARIVRRFTYDGDGYEQRDTDTAIAASLANDLLGLPTIWRDDDADPVEGAG